MVNPNQREAALLEAAGKLPPEARAAYLDRECAGDPTLRQRIDDALLAPFVSTVRTTLRADLTGGATGYPASELAGEHGGDLLGRYKLLEKVGEGGMGRVWIAEQREPVQRKVALKVIKLGMDTGQVLARFQAEQQALALMDHPNIAKVFDAGSTEKGRPFFVMELVNGIPITDYCDRHNLPPVERLKLFLQICYAVQHAHQKGIIHRDIKPSNILVTLQDYTPTPKVIDFGIAKAISGQRLSDKTVHTALEDFIGTPAYMSPEQAEMNALGIDARSDIYSLGVLLYELLTGLTPFRAEMFARLSTDEIRHILREKEPPRPSTSFTTLAVAERETVAKRRQCEPPKLVHLLRGELDWIVMKCLEKDRTRRYDQAEALAEDIQRHLQHEPVLARPPSQLYRLGKLIRRHKLAFSAAIAVLVLAPLLALGLVRFWPSARRAIAAERHLEQADQLLKQYDAEGHLSGALTHLKEAAQADPSSAKIWARLGWTHWLINGEVEKEETRFEALRCSSNSLSLNPENPEGHLVQGLIARSLNDWPSATNHLLKAKELTRSANGLILVHLAVTCQSAGDSTNAQTFAQLAEQNADDDWQVWYRLGLFRFSAEPREGDLQLARRNFERAVALAPESPLAQRYLGHVLLQQKQYEEALKHCTESVKLRPMPESLSAVGSVYLGMQKYDLAADYFLQASKADPSKYMYHFNAGLAYFKSGQATNEADAEFTKAVRQTRDTLSAGGEKPLVRAHQGFCLVCLGQREQGQQDLERALDEAGKDMRVLRIILNGYSVLGDTNKLHEIEKVIRERMQSPPSAK